MSPQSNSAAVHGETAYLEGGSLTFDGFPSQGLVYITIRTPDMGVKRGAMNAFFYAEQDFALKRKAPCPHTLKPLSPNEQGYGLRAAFSGPDSARGAEEFLRLIGAPASEMRALLERYKAARVPAAPDGPGF
jgi:hypothetical protein